MLTFMYREQSTKQLITIRNQISYALHNIGLSKTFMQVKVPGASRLHATYPKAAHFKQYSV